MWRRAFPLLLCLGIFAGCDAAPSRTPPSDPMPRPDPATAPHAVEFRGQRPCADCAGIDAWLRLDAGEAGQRYRLVERYLGARGQLRFEDEGEWTAHGDLLLLRSAQGSERTYLLGPDGSLQARGVDGAPLPALVDEVLLPTRLGDEE